MLPQYRTALSLTENGYPVHLDTVRDVILAWATRVSGEGDLSTTDEPIITASGCTWEHMEQVDAQETLLACRLTRPQETQRVTWITDIATRTNPERTIVYASVGVENLDPGRDRIRYRVHPPQIISELTARFSVSSGSPIQPTHMEISDQTGVDELGGLIAAPLRQLPVACVSVDNFTERPAVTTSDLHKRLLGICHVTQITKQGSRLFQNWFEERIDGTSARLWGVYNGAIRVYWPNLSLHDEGASPYDHPLWLKGDIDARFPDVICRLLARWSSLRPIPGWADINVLFRSRGISDDVRSSKDLRTAEELLDTALRSEARMAKLAEEQAKELQEQLDELNGEYQILQASEQAHRHNMRELQHTCTDLQRRLEEFQSLTAGEWTVHSYRTGAQADRDVVEAIIDEHAYATVEIKTALNQLRHDHFWSNSGGKLSSLGGGLWEFRINVKDHWIRLFVARHPHIRAVTILHGYHKQQNALDKNEVRTANERLGSLFR